MKRAGWLAALPFLAAAACGSDEPVVEPRPLAGASSPFRYPLELWDRRVEGETVLLVRVTEEGSVDSVEVYRSSGHAAFDSAALRGARDLRFVPARRGDRDVTAWARLPVRFNLEAGAGAGGREREEEGS